MFKFKSAAFMLGCLSLLTLPVFAADETAGQYMEGSTITANVKAHFLADPSIKSLNISVSTDKGAVTLTGMVDNQAEIDKAAEIAKTVNGVTSVNNQLKLKTLEQPPIQQ